MVLKPLKVLSAAPIQPLYSWYILFFQLPLLPELSVQFGFVEFLVKFWSPTTDWTKNSHLPEITSTFSDSSVAVRRLCFLAVLFMYGFDLDSITDWLFDV